MPRAAEDPKEQVRSPKELLFDLKLEREAFLFQAEGCIPLSGVTGIFGPSGSGKSTFLRTIAGLEPTASGRLEVGGRVFQGEEDSFAPPESRHLGVVFQEAALFPHLNVEENLRYSYKRAERSRRRDGIGEVVDWVGIRHLLAHRTDALSGGERQRVAIARALLSFPDVLLMDEPLASLDEQAKRHLLSVIERVARERQLPIFYVTHSTMELARLADRVLLFENGGCGLVSIGQTLARQELYSGGPGEVLSRLDIQPAGYDDKHHIAHYLYGDETLHIPAGRPPRAPCRLIIRASELSLSLSKPQDSSVLNAISATIARIEHLEPKAILVHCRTSGGTLVASVTSLACERLELAPGRACVLQFKATALFSGDPIL